MPGPGGDPVYRRKNSPFSKDESTFIIFQFGKLESLTAVRRAFRTKFSPTNPKAVPNLKAFQRIEDRFVKSGSIKPQASTGRIGYSDEDVQRVKTFFQDNEKAVELLRLCYGTIWKSCGRV